MVSTSEVKGSILQLGAVLPSLQCGRGGGFEVQTGCHVMGQMLESLAHCFKVRLEQVVETKQACNERKYPREKSLSSAGSEGGIRESCRDYSAKSGVGKNTASEALAEVFLVGQISSPPAGNFTSDWAKEFLQRSKAFANARGWSKYDSTVNLYLAIVGEVGELSQEAAFLPDGEAVGKVAGGKILSELADVFIYLCRFAEASGVFGDWMEVRERKSEEL